MKSRFIFLFYTLFFIYSLLLSFDLWQYSRSFVLSYFSFFFSFFSLSFSDKNEHMGVEFVFVSLFYIRGFFYVTVFRIAYQIEMF